MSSPNPSVPTAITRADVVKIGQSLPVAPRIMAQLGDMLNDVDTDIHDIARQVRNDPALTSRVIWMSKSILFSGGADVRDLDEALARVGFSSVLGLVGAASASQLSATPLKSYGIDVDTFQQCSLCHALSAETLARELGEDVQAAYIAGLLRSVGMIVLDRFAAPWLAPEAAFNLERDQCYTDFELKTFGLTSGDATRMLLDEWAFPEAIVSAIDFHHLATEEALESRLACVLNVAGEIAAVAGRAFPGDTRHWTAAPEKYEVLGISREAWDRISSEATARFSAACAALSDR